MLADEPNSTAATVDTPDAVDRPDDVDSPAVVDTEAAGDTPIEAPVLENLLPQTEKEKELAEKVLKAHELYTRGSRNYLVKAYAKAADDLSQVCALYGELHGELADELGLPYLFYGKSLVALALDENKVIDVPDQEEDDDDEDGEEYDEEKENEEVAAESTNGVEKSEANCGKMDSIKEDDEGAADSSEIMSAEQKDKSIENAEENAEAAPLTPDNKASKTDEKNGVDGDVFNDGEKPSTSNGEAKEATLVEEDEENDAGSNLQLGWEILELAARIFERQGERGLSNLAEVHAELGNIQFENNQLEAARGDYEKVIKIYKALPSKYRRAMAEIHYKVGLTYLMQQSHKESAAALKEACDLIAEEIKEIEAKPDPTEKDKSNIQDMEETKQELEAKITEIEETQAQNVAEVRAALDSYIKPVGSGDADAGPSTSSVTASDTPSAVVNSGSSPSKPNDITHLIKRKISKEDCYSEAEAVACSPAKRPAV